MSPDLPVLDPKTVDNLRVLAGANRPGEDILAEFVALFARDAVTRVVLIRDGWQRGQPQAVWDAAHALKGSAATLGAVRVHALAEAIDRIAKPIAKSGATTLPMTASDAAMVDQLVDEVAVAIDRMHTDFLGRPAPSR